MNSAQRCGLLGGDGRRIEKEEIAMRDIVAVEFVSVDGVAEAPEKWTTR